MRGRLARCYARVFIAACALTCRVGPYGVRPQHERHQYTRPQVAVMWVGAAVVVAGLVADVAGVLLPAWVNGAVGGAGAVTVATLLYGRPPKRGSGR